jgi:hypothetical protein
MSEHMFVHCCVHNGLAQNCYYYYNELVQSTYTNTAMLWLCYTVLHYYTTMYRIQIRRHKNDIETLHETAYLKRLLSCKASRYCSTCSV